MNNKKNLLSALVYQAVILLQGLILPRLIISTFGSDVNGLVSSITQFLSFISLLEGGLGAVVLAELYHPIEENNYNLIHSIIFASQKLFKRLAVIYIGYTALVAVIYPLFIAKNYSFKYTASLVLILSITTLSQYLFAISNKLMLQAVQKIYIVNFTTSGIAVLNIIISLLLIKLYPDIHIIKLFSGLLFFIQPVVYAAVVDKKYKITLENKPDENFVFKERWSGFGQNLAYFINMNTDIAVISIFSSLPEVSVYSIYMLSVNALRQLITGAAISYQSALGKYYVSGDTNKINTHFSKFKLFMYGATIILYCTCLQLINPFVFLYTRGVDDANYYQPIFAYIMVMANLIYCTREPFRVIVMSAGKFRETNFGAILEAVLNILISIALINWLGLIGVAVGTLIAISYRFVYLAIFVNKKILNYKNRKSIIYGIIILIVVLLNTVFYFAKPLTIHGYGEFILYGMVITIIEAFITCGLFFVTTFIFGEKITFKGEKK